MFHRLAAIGAVRIRNRGRNGLIVGIGRDDPAGQVFDEEPVVRLTAVGLGVEMRVDDGRAELLGEIPGLLDQVSTGQIASAAASLDPNAGAILTIVPGANR